MNSLKNVITNMKLKWENEDELPELSKEIYDAMFLTSIVNGVRLFPYMELVDGTKFYFIQIEEIK